MYPNTVSGLLNIKLSKIGSDFITIELYNIYGQKIEKLFEGKIVTELWNRAYDLSFLPNGIYMINVTGTTSSVQRFVKL